MTVKNGQLIVVNEWINDEVMIIWINMIELYVDVYSMCEYIMWSASIIMWDVVDICWWLLRCLVWSENYCWSVSWLFIVKCGAAIIVVLLSLHYCMSYILCCRCCERDESQVQMLALVTCPKLRWRCSRLECWDPIRMKNHCWVGTTCI